VERALETLLNLYRTIRYSLSQRYELELALSRLAKLRHFVTPSELLKRIEGLKGDVVAGAFVGGSAQSLTSADEKKN
jgi:DNA polymerase-3 subunit gamma/tau